MADGMNGVNASYPLQSYYNKNMGMCSADPADNDQPTPATGKKEKTRGLIMNHVAVSGKHRPEPEKPGFFDLRSWTPKAKTMAEVMATGVLGSMSCACPTVIPDCRKTIDTDGNLIKAKFLGNVTPLLVDGRVKLRLVINFYAENETALVGAKIYIKAGTRQKLMGANGEGKYEPKDVDAGEYNVCAENGEQTEIKDCTSFADGLDMNGLLPVSVPMQNKDGMYMLDGNDDRRDPSTVYASFGKMKDLKYGKEVYKYYDDSRHMDVLIASRYEEKWVDGESTFQTIWYEVNEDGTVVEGSDGLYSNNDVLDENGAVKGNPAFAYYETDGTGETNEYKHTTTVQTPEGQEVTVPVPDPSLKDIAFQIKRDDNVIKFSEIYLGRLQDPNNPQSERAIWGEARNAQGNIDFKEIEKAVTRLRISGIKIVDRRDANTTESETKNVDDLNISVDESYDGGRVAGGQNDGGIVDGGIADSGMVDAGNNDSGVIDGGNVDAGAAPKASNFVPISQAKEFEVDPRFYSDGNPNFDVEFEFDGNVEDLPNLRYFPAAMLMTEARSKMTEGRVCLTEDQKKFPPKIGE